MPLWGHMFFISSYIVVNINRVTGDVIKRDNTEYSSHALAEVVDMENMNDCILVTIYRTVK